jgi:hypothetical protein
MLLELRQLSQSLGTAGVNVPSWDGHLKSYSKSNPVFRVTISEAGQVRDVARVAKDQATVLLKYEVHGGGSRESIPGFNVPPLLAAKESEREVVEEAVKRFLKRVKRPPNDDSPAARRAELEAIVSRCSSGWAKKDEAIRKCLTTAVDVVAAHLETAGGAETGGVAPLRELLRRAKKLNPEMLHSAVATVVQARIIDGTWIGPDAESGVQFLFAKDAVCLLELADWTEMSANHEAVWHAVNRVLLAAQQSVLNGTPPVGVESYPADAFGDRSPLTNEVMPELNLPSLGPVKLRSNSANKPCQTRYGMTEGASFPVGREGRLSMASSLRWLRKPEREGKTFRDLTGFTGSLKREGGKTKPRGAILFAYPDPLPDHPPAIAAVIARTGQRSPTAADARFEAAAELVVSQLDTLRTERPQTTVRMFVLVKRDKARTKLLLSRQLSADRIIQAVRDWRVAAANIPPVFVRQPDEDKRLRWARCDDAPFPAEVARCLNRVWQRGGERAESVAVFDFGAALTLLLEDGHLLADTAGEALRLAVSQWVPLLLAMGQAACLRRPCEFSQDEQCLLPVILGLLLFKLGQRKEDYMKAMPYWLGRLMAIADKLHRNYCDRERDGQIPKGPLLGNAAISACLENPRAGLAELAHRIPLYQRVAGVELSTEVAEIVRHIDADHLPNRTTDEHKAQMLLGYLTRPDLLGPATADEENRS